MSLTLMYITNDSRVALIAEKCGVERIWIDLETLGKEERQKGMNTVKSKHSISDIALIKSQLTTAQVLTRINPIHAESQSEIDAVINNGTDLIMLPMWKTVGEVKQFIDTVAGRCRTILLLETREAEECLEEILKIPGIDEIHIGLNDLHLSYGLTFMFELLANGTVERITKKIQQAGIPYGFGGIAKLGSGDLPAERIITEHYRLGSTRAILSRSFCNTDVLKDIDEISELFTQNLTALREYEEKVATLSTEAFEENRVKVVEAVNKIVEMKKGIK